MKVAIVGDGQMGLVMGETLVTRGVSATLWGPSPAKVDALATTRRSPARLANFVLPDAVEVTADPAELLADAEVVLNAIPTQFIRAVWTGLRDTVPPGVGVVCVSKGIEQGTHRRPLQIIEEVLGAAQRPAACTCALSGPTIAAELARHLPATMVAASEDAAFAERVQSMFEVPWLRVYRGDDVLGVELAGATKNVIALAAGMVDGLEAGDNAKSSLLARGLAEIARLGVALGARVDTFFGVAGVGDLATTCFSPCGRNRTCGERLGRGETLASILESTASVVEGVPTTKAVVELARQHDVDMPITHAVHAILFEGLQPKDAIKVLMGRERKTERIG